MTRWSSWWITAFVLLALPVQLSAQADSVPPDSVRPVEDPTARFIEASAGAGKRVPVLPRVGPAGPLPSGSRMVFNRDSLEWSGAGSLADLLAEVPGVFIWRAGWLVQPEMANYRGRGPASVSYYLDGLPLTPMGPDSVGVDPGGFSLGLLDRVEVLRWPDRLVVHMYSRRHDREAPASRIAIGTGDQSAARYQATFEKRWGSGIGLGIGGDFLNFPTGTATRGDRLLTQVWGQASWVPSEKFGLLYQLRTSDIDRDTLFSSTGDALTRQVDGTRTDHQFRLHFASSPGPTGFRSDLQVGRTSWSGSGVDQQLANYGVTLLHRSATTLVRARAGGVERRTPVDLGGELSVVPVDFFAASVEGAYQQHSAERTSLWGGVRSGVTLPFGVYLDGRLRWGHEVATPAVIMAPEENVGEAEVTLGFRSTPLDLAVSGARTSSFRPQSFQPYLVVDTLRPGAVTDWLTVSGRIRPVNWLTLEGWFAAPVADAPDGQPPSQGWFRAAIDSKFWRTFPSSTFNLRLQGTIEAWGEGVLGLDSAGQPVVHPAATFFSVFFQLELSRFRLFYERRNLLAQSGGQLPGHELPAAQIFGVRWDFLN